jgi:sugar phosphate permease
MAAQTLPTYDKEAVRRSAIRKNAWRLLPLLILAFIFNYIDRTSVGFAAITMNKDLGLTATEFGWGAGVLLPATVSSKSPAIWHCIAMVPAAG